MRPSIPLCLLMVVLSCSVPAGAVDAFADNAPLEHMFAPLQFYDWPEEAVVEMESLLEKSFPGQSQEFDEKRIRLASLYRALGRHDETLTTLYLMTLNKAATDDLAWTAKVLWGLAWAASHREKREKLSEVASLAFAEISARSVKMFQLQNRVLRMAKEYRFRLILDTLPLAKLLDDHQPPISEEELPEEIAQILLGLLRPNQLFELKGREAESAQSQSISPEQRRWIGQNRPLRKALVRSAEVLALDLQDLDLSLFGPGQLVEALVKNRSADLEAARGRLNKAVAYRQSALSVFRMQNRQEEMINALDGLTEDLITIGVPSALIRALFVSEELIQLHESRIARLGPKGIGRYQAFKSESYDRHKKLLQRLLLMEPEEPALADLDVSIRLVLHADRMRLRPIRREIVLYRGMNQAGHRLKLMQALEKSKHAVEAARNSLSKTRQEGRERKEFRANTWSELNKIIEKSQTGDVILWEGAEPSRDKATRFEGGPYAKLSTAKSNTRSLITTLGASALGMVGVNPELPTNWQRLTENLAPDEAIVTYIEFSHAEPLMAAVISRKGKPRIIDLQDASLEKVQKLIQKAVNQLGAGSMEADKTIDVLSRLLWHPLGVLPEQITIVPVLSLLGIPFEAFVGIDGRRVVETHKVRYALGLGDGIGEKIEKASYSSSVIVGAYEFSHRPDLARLSDSEKEVTALRRMMSRKGILVRPDEPFPDKGSSWLMQDSSADILHVSTHAVWDKEDPMFDVLVFPKEDVIALELALAPIRAQLSVFSACNLFKLRATSNLNPVSGITTAALATIAPQVVTTLWSIEPGTTRLFMERFYEYLLNEVKPATALALTKRMFLSASRLHNWMENHNLSMPNGLNFDKVAGPSCWAPFILVIDSSPRS